jgi:hypothetical protein
VRAACVIILTSGKAESLRWCIDTVIQTVLDEKRVPILVLGPDADALLPAASKIEKCEIVFDPNYAGDEFSGIKAGLHITSQPAFIWNGSGEFPDASTRVSLEAALKRVPGHVLSHPGDTSQSLISRIGIEKLRELGSDTEWRKCPGIQFGSA